MKKSKNIFFVILLMLVVGSFTGCEEVSKYVGTWNTTDIKVAGESVKETFGEAGNVTLILEEEGKGTLQIAEQIGHITWVEIEGKEEGAEPLGVVITDAMDVVVDFNENQEGVLVFEIEEIQYTLEKVAENENEE